MNKSGKYLAWIEVGYEMFAREGVEGIQVERLARILNLNKSGFYHYFGDRSTYLEHLMEYHQKQLDIFVEHVATKQQLDPDYLELLAEHPLMMMVNMQVIRNRQIEFFDQHANAFHTTMAKSVMPLWMKYFGLMDEGLAIRYFGIVRDVIYSRMNFNNISYDLFHKVIIETKSVMDDMAVEKLHSVLDPSSGFLRQA